MSGTLDHKRPRPAVSHPRAAWADEKLLVAYRDHGDRPAFEELVRRYEKELYGYLRNYLGDADLAEDVFQQTFLQVHLKCHQFEPQRKLRPWLYAVATNQAIDLRRRSGRHRMASLDRQMGTGPEGEAGAFVELFDSPGRGPVEETEASEERDRIYRVVDELPEPTREVVMLVYFQGLKYREAADVLGIPVGTVKSRLHAAIQKLGEALTPP
ncbi:MAG: RNA polymerase sigma factor [Thermoguttaceae bacterium]|jgi:RNA polymerase sigma-70 factor (ECF subfamily)